jgi:hypothetical protein
VVRAKVWVRNAGTREVAAAVSDELWRGKERLAVPPSRVQTPSNVWTAPRLDQIAIDWDAKITLPATTAAAKAGQALKAKYR